MNVIFDFDGCLINSLKVQKKAYYESYEKVVGDDNCPSFDEYYKHTGGSITDVFRIMGFPIEMIDVYRKICTKNIPLNDVNYEAIELIKEYRNKGWKFGLCTGKDRFRTIDILKYNNLEYLFDALICGDDVKQSKPSPEPLITTMKALGASKENTLYIGDGYNDLLAANKIDVTAVLTLWYGDVGVPRECKYVVNSVEELRNIFEKYKNVHN